MGQHFDSEYHLHSVLHTSILLWLLSIAIMELLNFLHFLTFLALAAATSHADPDFYWKSNLPNTPMPKAIRDLLHDGGDFTVSQLKVSRDEAALAVLNRYATEEQFQSPNVAIFFLEKDLHRGTSMNLRLVKSINTAAFLPRKVADSIPFSSNYVPEILSKYSLKPESEEAENIKKTVKECEEAGIKGEEKYCATSLESMIDFSTSKLGKNVQVVSTQAQKEDTKSHSKYTILDVWKLNNNDKVVTCHKKVYVYAVFDCHTFHTKVYMVSLLGADGAKTKAVAVCHTDTAAWNPKHWAFQVLKVKPGTVPICHFLPEDHILWIGK